MLTVMGNRYLQHAVTRHAVTQYASKKRVLKREAGRKTVHDRIEIDPVTIMDPKGDRAGKDKSRRDRNHQVGR